MEGYAKLWSSIIHSTVWREPDHVRILWITMLAMSDSEGYVGASIPGLADAAKISLASCELALTRLEGPDLYSRTTEFEGRRIMKVEGGWIILNYRKHREEHDEDERQRQNRERQRRFREKKAAERNANSNDAALCNVKSNDKAEAEAEAVGIKRHRQKSARTTQGVRGNGAAAAAAEGGARGFARAWIAEHCPSRSRSGLTIFTRLVERLGAVEAARQIEELLANPEIGNPFAYLESKLDRIKATEDANGSRETPEARGERLAGKGTR